MGAERGPQGTRMDVEDALRQSHAALPGGLDPGPEQPVSADPEACVGVPDAWLPERPDAAGEAPAVHHLERGRGVRAGDTRKRRAQPRACGLGLQSSSSSGAAPRTSGFGLAWACITGVTLKELDVLVVMKS